MSGNIMEVKHLQTQFTRDNQKTVVLDHVSFHIKKGEVLGLVGESGCGKSVTSLSIMRLFKDTTGEITNGEIVYNGTNLLSISESDMRRIRGKEISMIFQEPMTSLNPVMKIGEQLMEAIRLHLGYSDQKAREQAVSMLTKVGIPRPSEIMGEYPHQLSGGMRQRIMIAMAMSCNPNLLIADEPTTALDVTIQAQILDVMKQLQAEEHMSMLLITHDLGVVAEMCNRVVVMYAGRVVEEASVYDLFDEPKHPYTKGLIGSVPKIGQKRARLDSVPGNVPTPNNMPKGCKFAPRCKDVMPVCWEKEPVITTVGKERFCRCWLYQGEGRDVHV
ncbi:ABC transporter ATP-binding protein [Brevibacillus formosus]|uniref:ABC transporter ATP-binding protein n=1 Tax=Brevibacillus TaxID=55080 RepID=UPI000D0FFE0A|nr:MULTISPECIES: ABC transporter ATP-binding protein [Brevibacillus]MBG9943742.1 peptide ABC transporter ATP-binding protein [Brevibacillus formosus]MED1945244.1 ABC transporter ATP-binding protein [Brevibacillus formosus]MED1998633.1 ABC transporter ATP-binding protein [Brevibacillus formosus]MED2083602.1 ABC transporter ATP-binding protein [Brevibacillus formosus]PSK20994.1 peptide ABC transporter ATP-binding protein [Brevibacillus sp. NRRL NRS-603]